MTTLKDKLLWRLKFKFNRPQVLNHWGTWLHSDVPTTGVFSGNEIQWYPDDFLDPELESHIAECEHCTNFNPCDVLDFWEPPYELWGNWIIETDSASADFQKFIPDKKGEYSAIYNRDSNTIQVVHSTYFQLGNPCSPCYPGQVEFSKTGKYIAYSLPYDMLYPDDLPLNRLTLKWIIKERIENKTYKIKHLYWTIKHKLKTLRMRLNHYRKDFKS